MYFVLLLTSLDGRLCQVYPDHLSLGAGLTWAGLTSAVGTLGLLRPRVQTRAADPEMWGINTRDYGFQAQAMQN